MSTVKTRKPRTQEEVLARLSEIGTSRVELKYAFQDNGADMNDTICLGFDLGLTAKQMGEALGNDPHTGNPVVGQARIFQIRDGKFVKFIRRRK